MVVFMTDHPVVTLIITCSTGRYNKNYNSTLASRQQPIHQPVRRLRDDGARREDFGSSRFQHRVIVLRRDDAARDDEHVALAELPQRVLELGGQGPVARGERGGAA